MPIHTDQLFAVIDTAASGNNTVVAAVVGKKIRVTAFLAVGAGAVNITFQSGAGGSSLTGAMPLAASTVISAADNRNGWFETAAGALLNANLSAAVGVRGCLKYVLVD